MYLKEIGLDEMDWIDLAQDRDAWIRAVSTLMDIWVLKDVGTERLMSF
jgi:hypothetical protein